MARFSRQDAAHIKNARVVLRNPAATAEEKSAAERLIERLQSERQRRIAAKTVAGKQPLPKDFAIDEEYITALRHWWLKLDRMAAEREANKILCDPNSSTYLRRKAYEKLGLTKEDEEPDFEPNGKGKRTSHSPSREGFGFTDGHCWDEFVSSGKEAKFQEALDEWRRKTNAQIPPELAALFDKGEQKHEQ